MMNVGKIALKRYYTTCSCWATHHSIKSSRSSTPTHLLLKDLSILIEQVGSLHARAAGLGAHHESPVSVTEALSGVDANRHLHGVHTHGVERDKLGMEHSCMEHTQT